MKIRFPAHGIQAISVLFVVINFCLMLPVSLPAGQAILKYSENGIFQDERNGMMWQVERSNKMKSVQEVENFLKELNSGKYDDWRLPTKEELSDLFTIFDLKNNGDVKIRLEGSYWILGRDSEVQVGSWEIGDGCGPTRAYYTKKAGYLRAVRP